MKVLAFAASSSRQSINKKLIGYAASLMKNAQVEIVDLNDYECPLFSVDRESELGQPELAKLFFEKIGESDALLISYAEHNGCYSAAYKNLYDWCSRIHSKVFQNKPMVMLATSPGARGGTSVLQLATQSAPFYGGDLKASLSLPSFYDNFDVEKGCLSNPELDQQLRQVLNQLNPKKN